MAGVLAIPVRDAQVCIPVVGASWISVHVRATGHWAWIHAGRSRVVENGSWVCMAFCLRECFSCRPTG